MIQTISTLPLWDIVILAKKSVEVIVYHPNIVQSTGYKKKWQWWIASFISQIIITAAQNVLGVIRVNRRITFTVEGEVHEQQRVWLTQQARTADGIRIEIAANIAHSVEAIPISRT